MTNVICENCGTENPNTVKFCKQCGTRLLTTIAEPAMTAAPALSPVSPAVGPPTDLIEKRYGALRGIAGLCRALAIILAILAFLGGMGSFLVISESILGLLGVDNSASMIGAVIGASISALVTYIFWSVIADIISVQLDIEENTRRSATLLERQMK
jgi:hypothetical protein